MTVIAAAPPVELFLRSLDASWTRARWERLPEDGNRYDVIDGVLYLSTAPSFFHQWIHKQLLYQLARRRISARSGVPEYWAVRPSGRDALVSRAPRPTVVGAPATGDYRTVAHSPADGELASPTLPVRCPIAALCEGAFDTTV